ncbi:hypothetical protein [Aestuariivivens sediminis]|uniref:hypothetical protein n=1 Tax=Aestuariivivens sediminis TaxID=2913557 RepID=UPI001F59CC8D|nr:hypothetical protein [Aestuariivivens sediminis]
MKRYLFLLLFGISTICLNSCAAHYLSSSKWKQYEMPPSRIIRNGEVFFGGKLPDGSKFSVFADETIDNDASYYYTMLMQDFGWSKKDEKTWTAPQDSREYKLGHIYINPSRQAAIYFYPNGNYLAFRVNISN